MTLLIAKPLFTTFEICMMAFIVVMVFFWISLHISNRNSARKHAHKIKERRHMKVSDDYDSAMTSDSNRTFKN